MTRKFRVQTIVGRLFLQFGVVLFMIIVLTSLVQFGIMRVAKNETYQRMQDQSEFYLDALHKSLSQIKEQQINVMHDWNLINLTVNSDTMSDYEKRTALLALKERLSSLEGSFSLVDDIALYIPGIQYVVKGNTVKKMTAEDQERIDVFQNFSNDSYYRDETGVYLTEMSSGIRDGVFRLSQMCIVHISAEEIEAEMGQVLFGDNSGAFFMKDDREIVFRSEAFSQDEYRPDEEQMDSVDSGIATMGFEIAKDISAKLQKEDEGFVRMQTVKVGRIKYLCFVSEADLLGTFVQYTQHNVVMQEISRYQKALGILWVCIVMATAVIILFVQRQIHHPIQTLLGGFEKVKEGRLDERIHYQGQDEFHSLYYGFNDMQGRIQELVERLAEQKNLTQNAQLKQLQAQINPHFLYNCFFMLNSRLKLEDYEDASKFAELMGNYFKFVTRNTSDWTSLADEVEHARCYARIQESRFSKRIRVHFGELPERCREIRVPRLIVQPLLENAFGHGLEHKVKDGILKVVFREEKGLRISVEDNGEEEPDRVVALMRQRIQDQIQGELPAELEESAKLDGAGQGTILTRICLPLSKPSIATVTLFSLITHWNSYFDGLIYSNHTDNYPLQSYIQTMVVSTIDLLRSGDVSALMKITQVNDTNLRAAQIFISVIPLMIVYPFLQKYFTTGLVLGSVKG